MEELTNSRSKCAVLWKIESVTQLHYPEDDQCKCPRLYIFDTDAVTRHMFVDCIL